MLIDSKGKINVATLGGIFEMQQSGDSVYFENLSPKFGTVLNEIYLVIESNDGSFWLASKSGFIHTRKNLYHPSPPPKVFFTGMFRNNQPDSSISSLKSSRPFSYKENNLVFDFTATSFRNESQLLYSYKLEKYNDSSKWSLPRPIHSVSLLALSPGSYALKVKAVTMDNVWSEVPAEYSFIINAPFWSTWWFRTLIVLFVAGTVAGFSKFRLNQLRKVMAVRTKISRDLHDEIGSTLSGIGLMSEIVKEQMENENYKAVKNSVGKISTSSEEILGKMSDIVWAINPQNDTFEKMIKRLKTYATGIAALPGIHLHFDSEKELEQTNLDMQQRNNIYLICKEAINNAIKYSDCNHLHFALRNYDHRFQIDIWDDGKGFDVQQSSDGNGLKNMQSRADEIKAGFSIKSEKDKGTHIKLLLKIT
jgi:two-component sensor histidine kinase